MTHIDFRFSCLRATHRQAIFDFRFGRWKADPASPKGFAATRRRWKAEHIVVLLVLMVAGAGFAVLGPEVVADIEFNGALEKAWSGDARAMFLLARLYETGTFCKQDNEMAGCWYREAANNDPGVADMLRQAGKLKAQSSKEAMDGAE